MEFLEHFLFFFKHFGLYFGGHILHNKYRTYLISDRKVTIDRKVVWFSLITYNFGGQIDRVVLWIRKQKMAMCRSNGIGDNNMCLSNAMYCPHEVHGQKLMVMKTWKWEGSNFEQQSSFKGGNVEFSGLWRTFFWPHEYFESGSRDLWWRFLENEGLKYENC